MFVRVFSLLPVLLFLQPALAFDQSHVKWTALLKKHVIMKGPTSKVDYDGFKRDMPALESYLKDVSSVTKVEYDQFTREQKMAFLINAYNALTVQIVTQHYPVKSIKDIGSLFRSTWKIKFFKLLGDDMNLDEVEHGYLRRNFQEPRVHFAVNCASIGCPALRPEAYTAAKLNTQLDEQAKLFLRDTSRNRLDPANKKLILSMIFKWFHEDFERNGNTVQKFVSSYITDDPAVRSALNAGGYDVDYLTYDWNLNGA